jgi:hypothetical protein
MDDANKTAVLFASGIGIVGAMMSFAIQFTGMLMLLVGVCLIVIIHGRELDLWGIAGGKGAFAMRQVGITLLGAIGILISVIVVGQNSDAIQDKAMPETWTTYSNYMSGLMLAAMVGTTAVYAMYTEESKNSGKIQLLQFFVYLCFTAGCIFALMQYVVAHYFRTSG